MIPGSRSARSFMTTGSGRDSAGGGPRIGRKETLTGSLQPLWHKQEFWNHPCIKKNNNFYTWHVVLYYKRFSDLFVEVDLDPYNPYEFYMINLISQTTHPPPRGSSNDAANAELAGASLSALEHLFRCLQEAKWLSPSKHRRKRLKSIGSNMKQHSRTPKGENITQQASHKMS